VLEEVVAPLTAAIAGLVPISGRVLWGNVASAINGAAGQVATRQPDLAGPVWAAAADLFASPWLSHETQPPGAGFRRSSCCLIYKIASERARARGVCGDCVLR
jgi:ferric iron reductase protein FhuF